MIDAMTKKPLHVSTDEPLGLTSWCRLASSLIFGNSLTSIESATPWRRTPFLWTVHRRSRLLILVTERTLLLSSGSSTASGDRSRMVWPCPMISGPCVTKF